MTSVPSPAIAWWPIVLCGLAVVFDGYDAQMLAMAIPLMAKEFHVVPTAFAMAASASLAGMAVGAMFLSPFADRFGRRPLLMLCLLLFGVPTLLAMQAGSPMELAFWRLLAGCGLGATVPVTIAITADLAPAHRRVGLVTMMASGFAVGASCAGQIAPFLSAWWGWRGLFAFGGLAPLLLVVLVYRGIKEPVRVVPAADAAPRPAIGLRVLFAPAYRFRTVLFWALNAINLFANYGLASWLPTLLVQNGWQLNAASRATSVFVLGALSGSFIVSRMVDRGRIVLSLAGAYLVAALALSLCATNPGSTGLWILLLVCIGFGAIGSQLTLGPLASSRYPAELRTTGVGWASGVGRAGSLFGPLALAWLMNQSLSPTTVLGALMIPMVLCAVCVCLLPAAFRAGERHGG